MINFLYIMKIAIDINEELNLISSCDRCGKFDFRTYMNISKLSAKVANDYLDEAVASTKNDIKEKIHINREKFDIKEYDNLNDAITQLIGNHFLIKYEKWYRYMCSVQEAMNNKNEHEDNQD